MVEAGERYVRVRRVNGDGAPCCLLMLGDGGGEDEVDVGGFQGYHSML
jgi:hypothetical protein